MYVQKALVFIGYKTVDTRSLIWIISKNGTVRTPLALHSPPFLKKFTCQLCLLFSSRNLRYATTLIRWEEGVGERWRRSGPEVRVTLKFFMSRSRVTNFHRLISCLFACCLSVIVVVIRLSYFKSIVLLFIYCILQDTPRTKRRASKLFVIDSSLIFFPVLKKRAAHLSSTIFFLLFLMSALTVGHANFAAVL